MSCYGVYTACVRRVCGETMVRLARFEARGVSQMKSVRKR
jgi:hypothetical protein